MASGWGFTTKAIHGGKMADAHKSVAPPLYQTATFYYDTADEGARLGQEIPPGYVYTRWANPTTRAFEEKVALLEGAEDALATASGMAAVSTSVLTALRRGEHAVAPSAIYQATYQLFADILPSYGIETTVIPDGEVASYERPMDKETKQPSGWAFVEMAQADAAKAIKAVNGQLLSEQALAVSEARPRS